MIVFLGIVYMGIRLRDINIIMKNEESNGKEDGQGNGKG